MDANGGLFCFAKFHAVKLIVFIFVGHLLVLVAFDLFAVWVALALIWKRIGDPLVPFITTSNSRFSTWNVVRSGFLFRFVSGGSRCRLITRSMPDSLGMFIIKLIWLANLW